MPVFIGPLTYVLKISKRRESMAASDLPAAVDILLCVGSVAECEAAMRQHAAARLKMFGGSVYKTLAAHIENDDWYTIEEWEVGKGKPFPDDGPRPYRAYRYYNYDASPRTPKQHWDHPYRRNVSRPKHEIRGEEERN